MNPDTFKAAVDAAVAERTAALRIRIKELTDMLEECQEYFEDRADIVDGPGGEDLIDRISPNKEMHLASRIGRTLEYGPEWIKG